MFGTSSPVESIAKVCHEANRAYCQTLGDHSQESWGNSPDWQRRSAINGVLFHLNHPEASPLESHANWFGEKVADGWIYGPVKDAESKQHPCCVPYNELPAEQRIKDSIFIGIVRAMAAGQLLKMAEAHAQAK